MDRIRLQYWARLLMMLALVGCASGRRISLPTDQGALSKVNAIHLGDFGSGNGSALVREKIRLRLLESKRFDVVESADRADASLVGSAGVETASTSESIQQLEFGLLRLVDRASQKTIWAHEYQRPRLVMVVGDVSSRVADQMTEQLLKEAGSRR